MANFEDYHRTVIGYHGTRRSVAVAIVQGERNFQTSRNRGDWLGNGVYFWEHAPQQAWAWAEQRRQLKGWNEETAVLASMIRLGACYDLLDHRNVEDLEKIYREYGAAESAAGRPLPNNRNHQKYLDCAVFQYAYTAIVARGFKVDSCRAVYVPTEKDKRVWKRSWITRQAHIQICVRNMSCILGTWLVKPSQESGDGRTSQESPKTLDAIEDQARGRESEKDVDAGENPAHGEGRVDDSGGGGQGQGAG